MYRKVRLEDGAKEGMNELWRCDQNTRQRLRTVPHLARDFDTRDFTRQLCKPVTMNGEGRTWSLTRSSILSSISLSITSCFSFVNQYGSITLYLDGYTALP
jgi:hypothetical protein